MRLYRVVSSPSKFFCYYKSTSYEILGNVYLIYSLCQISSVRRSLPTKLDIGLQCFSSCSDRMSGAVPIRLCILFDAEHARSNRKNKKTTTTSEIRVYIGVRSCGITGQLLNQTAPSQKNLSAQENIRSIVLKEYPECL